MIYYNESGRGLNPSFCSFWSLGLFPSPGFLVVIGGPTVFGVYKLCSRCGLIQWDVLWSWVQSSWVDSPSALLSVVLFGLQWLRFILFERGMAMCSTVSKTKSPKLFVHSFIHSFIPSFAQQLLNISWCQHWGHGCDLWRGQEHSCPCGVLRQLQQKDNKQGSYLLATSCKQCC